MIAPSSAPLGKHILHVVAMCTDGKMGGVYTRGIVAGVQNMHPRGYYSARSHFPRNAMRAIILPLPATDAVSTWATSPKPRPASRIPATSINLCPKSLGSVAPLRAALLVIQNVLSRLSLYISPLRSGSVGYGRARSAPAATVAKAKWPFLGSGGGCATIIIKHRKLHSGGPLGVSAPRGAFSLLSNYSQSPTRTQVLLREAAA